MELDCLGQGCGIGAVEAQREIQFTLNRLHEPAQMLDLCIRKSSRVHVYVVGSGLLSGHTYDEFRIPFFNGFTDSLPTSVDLLSHNDHLEPLFGKCPLHAGP